MELDLIADYADLGFSEHEEFELLVSRMNEGDPVIAYSAKILKVASDSLHYLLLILPIGIRSQRDRTALHWIARDSRHPICSLCIF